MSCETRKHDAFAVFSGAIMSCSVDRDEKMMCVVVQLLNPQWKPDFGPAEFVPNWGATVVGARKFLIAYNVNLLSTKEQAHRIALDIREQGRGPDQVGQLTGLFALYTSIFYLPVQCI